MKYLYTTIFGILLFNLGYSQVPQGVGIDIVLPSGSSNLSPEEKEKMLAPKATLDVNGTVQIETLAPHSKGNSDLFIDPTSGELLSGESPESALLGNYKFKIKCAPAQDWVEDFDTKIPADEYFLSITNANFIYSKYYDVIETTEEATTGEVLDRPNNKDWENRLYGISHQIDNDKGFSDHMRPLEQIEAFVQDGTWRLRADYRLANPYAKGLDNTNYTDYIFYWEIDTFLIHRSLITDLTSKIIKGSVSSSDYRGSANDNHPAIVEVKKIGELITPAVREIK